VLEDFVRRFYLPTRKSKVKTPFRLVNGHCVTSLTACDITLKLACREFQRNFYVLCNLRATCLVLGLPRLDDEQASLQFSKTRVFTFSEDALVDTQT
jgi:hypothetical protein